MPDFLSNEQQQLQQRALEIQTSVREEQLAQKDHQKQRADYKQLSSSHEEIKLKVKLDGEKHFHELVLTKSANFESMKDAIAAKLKAPVEEISEVLRGSGDDTVIIADDADVHRLESGHRLTIAMK